MATFYSAARNGFFDSALFSVMPTDAMAVTDEEHAALLTAQSKGKLIQADAKGNPVAVEAPAVAPKIPQQVTAFQARAALHAIPGKTAPATLLDDVNAAVTAAAVADPVASLAWEYAAVVTRQGVLVASIGSGLGLTSDQLDALFVAAAKIVA